MVKRKYCPVCSEPVQMNKRSCDECGLGKGWGERESIPWIIEEDE